MTSSVTAWPVRYLATIFVVPGLWLMGCRATQRRDYVVESVSNVSQTYRATVLVREHWREDKQSKTPTTYVLLDRYAEPADYENGADFKRSQIVMKPSRCGPVSLEWVGERTLKIRCDNCGISMIALGPHSSVMGDVDIRYEGFPEASSWETSLQKR